MLYNNDLEEYEFQGKLCYIILIAKFFKYNYIFLYLIASEMLP